MIINKGNIDQLKVLNYHLHDKWFNVNEIVYDKEYHKFQLKFGIAKEDFNETLKITGVLNCNINDTEKVCIYDIYGISIDLPSSKIIIEGCITIKIELVVCDNFEISII